MLKNYLIAALRNLTRNRLHTTINVAGLAIGFAAAILIYLFVREEMSYDRFLPGHDRTYLVSEHLTPPGQSTIATPTIQAPFAGEMKLDFPAVEAVARLCADRRTLRHGQTEADENVYWADPNVFDLLPLPALAGDLKTALQSPYGVVLTRSMARKYFGRDDPIGEVLDIAGTHPNDINRRYPMRVTAVIADLPANTHLDIQIILSGSGAVSELTQLDADVRTAGVPDLVYTYVRLVRGGSVVQLQQALPGFLARHDVDIAHYYHGDLQLDRFDRVHLTPATEQTMRPRGDLTSLYIVSLVGALVILVAGINFVNLMTARSARRAVEVGVRKSAGATRRQLVIQFIGESILYASVSMILAIALVEMLLPHFNSFLGQTIGFHYWRDPTLLAALLGVPILFGVMAGLYPALVLSAFTPVTVLKRVVSATRGSGLLRQVFVTVQFAVLITLIIASVIIHQQGHYALNEGLRLQKDQIVVIRTPCTNVFPEEVRRLPGVRAAACAWSAALNLTVNAHWALRLRDGKFVSIDGISVDYGFFELYGLQPVAGRFFSRDHAGDAANQDLIAALQSPDHATDAVPKPLGRMVINQAAVRLAGFRSPQQAIGSRLFARGRPLEVIGVVPDFSLDTVRKIVPPMFYVVYPPSFDILNVKLSGHDAPRTLAAIDGLWAKAGNIKPISRFFVDQHMEELYLDITRRAQVLGLFSAMTVLIACLGLLGLAAFTAERRTKEIGIRKATGADVRHIVQLLLWQFTKPVLWANVIAWPAAAYLMNRWLRGFAYHVELQPWVFAATGAITICVALLTVSTHSVMLARAKPVKALRYE
jgi:putative ABC transport system permease protein